MIDGMSTRVSSPVLVGRAAQLRQLRTAFERSAGGTASTVLVGGEAGIGKTRLIGEFLDWARGEGGFVLEGACVSLGSEEGLPLAPIGDALRAVGRELAPADVAEVVGSAGPAIGRLVPELGGATDPMELSGRPDWAQARMLEAILGVLHRLALRHPVVLVVEDLHWADESTRDVLAFISRSARSERLMVLATYRTDELHRRHPLRPWLAEMERTQRVERVALDRLDRVELAELLESISGGRPDDALVDAIASRSEGNPFYAEELLAAGATRPNDPLPGDLRDVLLARVGGLTEATQSLLGVAAVAGSSVEHDLVRDAAASTDFEVEDAMREAIAAGIVVASDEAEATYAFRHALLQEAVYDDLLPTERRRFHLAFAGALRARPAGDGTAGASHLAALAHHSTAAHDLPAALSAWIAAGRAGSEAYAFAAAARAFERALELWEAVPADDRPNSTDPVALLFELSFARLLAGDSGGSVHAARSAVEHFDASRDPTRGAGLLERLSRSAWINGDYRTALEAAEDSVRLLDGQPASETAARARAGYAAMLMLSGSYSSAIKESREAIEIAQAVGAETPEAHAMNTLGVGLALVGDCENGLEIAKLAFEKTAATNHVHDLGRAYANYGTALEICGRSEEAAELARQGSEWAERSGVWRTYGAFHDGNRASHLVATGRFAEAARLLARADDVALEGVAAMNHMINDGPLAVRMGNLERGHRLLDDAWVRAASFRDAQFSGPLVVGLVELAIAEGRHDDAWAIATRGADRLGATEDGVNRALVAAVHARVAADRILAARDRHSEEEAPSIAEASKRVTAHARALVEPLAPDNVAAAVPRAFIQQAEAEAARADGTNDPGAWEALVERWARLDRPYQVAYARYREAEALLEAGGNRELAAERLSDARSIAGRIGAELLRGDSEALARRARVALADSEPVGEGVTGGVPGRTGSEPVAGAASPAAEPQSPADPFGLTAREGEVLALVAAGHTNRRIAGALFISESTAGVHVSNILGKLGVATRAEAAAVAVRLGLAG